MADFVKAVKKALSLAAVDPDTGEKVGPGERYGPALVGLLGVAAVIATALGYVPVTPQGAAALAVMVGAGTAWIRHLGD